MKFELRLCNLNKTEILTFINEVDLNEIVHVEGVPFDLKEEKLKFKYARKIRIREYQVKDYTTIMKLAIFGDLIDKVTEKAAHKIWYLKVVEYDFRRYLKTTEKLLVTVQPDLNIEVIDVDKNRRWKRFNQYQCCNPNYVSRFKKF